MVKVYEFLANGFEEVEAMAPLVVLRRAGLDLKTVSISSSPYVETAHGVTMKADLCWQDVNDFDEADLLMMPGGLPGATNLNDFTPLHELLKAHHAKGKLIGAICAAPMVLGTCGLLKGRNATCYPGFEQFLTGATITHDVCTDDGDIVTAEGPAAAMTYGFQLASHFISPDALHELKSAMRYLHVMGEE